MKIYNYELGVKAIIRSATKLELPKLLEENKIKVARRFHSSIKGYKATPLVSLDNLAFKLGVSKIYVKDESYRFGLNSFKCLGATYAIANLLCELLEVNIEEVSFDYFKSQEVMEKIKNITFVTATDGNHGKAVAWASTQIGCRSVVYLPKGVASRRVQAIEQEGAEVYRTDLSYDNAVRLAAKTAQEEGWNLVQDTAWRGYEQIPNWIIQGYGTMADEALDQLKLDGINKPTHIFLQAGVGSMAGGVLGYYANKFKGNQPATIIMEPHNAACIYKSALINDGQAYAVEGDLNTIMAGLACGEPNPITWEILRDFAAGYISCPDYISARGIRILANPIDDDSKIISGESGSIGVGLLSLLMEKNELKDIREDIGLNQESIVLIFSTEGNTDPDNYNDIVYDGKYSYPFE